MFSLIRNNIFIRIICGIFGIYLLNISVDPPDPNPEHIPEDLLFNDQESIVEIILEKVLGFDDIIREYDDNDYEDSVNKNKKNYVFYNEFYSDAVSKIISKRNNLFPNNEDLFKEIFIDITIPPPLI